MPAVQLPRIPRVVAIAIAAILSLCAAAYLLAGARDARRLDRAEQLSVQGFPLKAARSAAQIHASPARAQALAIRARALAAGGRTLEALGAFAQAVAAAPSDWQLRRDWAVLLLGTGQRRAAQAQMTRARRLNPQLTLPAGFTD